MPDPLSVEQHRVLRDAADEAGHDGEAAWHEAEIDRMVFRSQRIAETSRHYLAAVHSGDTDAALILRAELDRLERQP